MRISDKMTQTQLLSNLQKNRTEMADLQNQASTMKRITKPSDDPTASARVLTARTEERGAQQFIKNISNARSFLEITDQSLSELSETLVRAKELALNQASDASASADTRRVVATEVEQLYNQTVQIGNRKLADRYIFGGYRTNQAPFDNKGEYLGDRGDIKVQINKDAFLAMNVSGDKIFHGVGVSADGGIRTDNRVPKNTAELKDLKEENRLREKEVEELNSEAMNLRNLSSEKAAEVKPSVEANGVNILRVLKDFEIALRVNDKAEVQRAIEGIDAALSQVISARASVGSRIGSLNAAQDSLQKSVVESKMTASQLEDADLFQVVSDMNRTESTLKATMETSGKVANLSLLDFLR